MDADKSNAGNILKKTSHKFDWLCFDLFDCLVFSDVYILLFIDETCHTMKNGRNVAARLKNKISDRSSFCEMLHRYHKINKKYIKRM